MSWLCAALCSGDRTMQAACSRVKQSTVPPPPPPTTGSRGPQCVLTPLRRVCLPHPPFASPQRTRSLHSTPPPGSKGTQVCDLWDPLPSQHASTQTSQVEHAKCNIEAEHRGLNYVAAERDLRVRFRTASLSEACGGHCVQLPEREGEPTRKSADRTSFSVRSSLGELVDPLEDRDTTFCRAPRSN